MTTSITCDTNRYNLGMSERMVTLPFGRALRLRRDKLGLTQPTLAERMGGIIDQSSVSKWEARAQPIRNYETLQRLAKVLNTTVDDLVEGRVPAEWLGVQNDTSDYHHTPLENLIREVAEEYQSTVSPEVIERGSKVLRGFYRLGEIEQLHYEKQLELLLLIHREHPPDPPTDKAANDGG